MTHYDYHERFARIDTALFDLMEDVADV